MKNRPYRPSNGTEGMIFEEKYCMNCINCDPDPNGDKQCDIWLDVLCFDIDDEEYPKEWIYQYGKPTCTAWVKWDWGTDGDPDDIDNPKAPILDDPNQLCFPFALDEIEGVSIKDLEVYNG